MKRALVIAPFFSVDMTANRSVSVACVLAQLASVDVITGDFDHWTKSPMKRLQVAPFKKIVYLKTLRYRNNTGFPRLISHVLLSISAAAYFLSHRKNYNIVYVTLPLNLLAWLVLRAARAQCKIVDVLDIWPDVLPFSPRLIRRFRLLFTCWRWLFNQSAGLADVMLAPSETFFLESSKYANSHCHRRLFYIGDVKLEEASQKENVLTVIYVGNIGHLYDFETLLDVMEDAKRASIQLFIVGDGDRRDWLLGELKRRELLYQYFGVVYDSSELGKIVSRAHIGFNGYVNTSAAFSYKANTYLAASLPLLNSMPGDLNVLVSRYRLGLNYVGGNRESLARCFKEINWDSLASMSQNCARFFAEELDRAKIRQDMLTFFRNSI